MIIDLSTGEWIQLGIAAATAMAAAAAWYSVRVQIKTLREDHERDRINRRYHELADVFGQVGAITGAITGRFQMFMSSGHADRQAALNDLGRVSEMTAALTLHSSPQDVIDAILRFGEHLESLTARLPPPWWLLPPRWWFAFRPVPEGDLVELQQLHLDVQRTARGPLEKLASRANLDA